MYIRFKFSVFNYFQQIVKSIEKYFKLKNKLLKISIAKVNQITNKEYSCIRKQLNIYEDAAKTY